MKSMLMHSFVLDALATTGPDTFSHFEELVNEHRDICMEAANDNNSNNQQQPRQSRLKRLVPTVGVFHTPLPLRRAYEAYNAKYKLDKRRHLAISFNEIRHILNLAQIMAFCTACSMGNEAENEQFNLRLLESPALRPRGTGGDVSKIPNFCLDDFDKATKNATTVTETDAPGKFNGPSMITFDGDQTLYSDGANFESNPKLATYLYLLLRNGVTVAVVTAAGYEYQTHKYELRLSGLLQFFQDKQPLLTEEQLNRFYLFGGECNYLLRLGKDYKLHPVKEFGAGGWMTATKYLGLDSPANWPENDVTRLLDLAEESLKGSLREQNLKAKFIRKKRSVGLVPEGGSSPPIPREALDETVLRVSDHLDTSLRSTSERSPVIPYCAFNGGRDVWVDVGNKRVGVQILQSYLDVPAAETLHIGDQFLNTGNDYAARQTCPCIWITSPDETTYVLKSILRLAGIAPLQHLAAHERDDSMGLDGLSLRTEATCRISNVDFTELERRTSAVATMDVYTGELLPPVVPPSKPTPAATASDAK